MRFDSVKKLLIAAAFCCAALAASAQDVNLANQYFANGEYEKAAALYLDLSEKDLRNDFYFNRYVECLMSLEQYEECEKAVKKQLKKSPDNFNLYVTYGNIFDRQGRGEEAKAQYAKAIEKMAPDFNAVNRLATLFLNGAKYELAIQTYETGAKRLNDPQRFSFNLGELYRRKGDNPKMIEHYLLSLDADPGKLGTVQTLLARYLPAADFPELQQQLYARIQAEETPEMVELLAWSFVQRKDFKSALRQHKALDKRTGDNGQRVFKLASDAAAAKDYDTAIAAYEYIVTEKGVGNTFYFDAKRELMNCRRKKITEGFSYTAADLTTLEAEYEAFLNQYGRGKATAAIVLQLADLEAYYLNNLPKAIALLDELRQSPGVDRNTQARVKINLADFYLMRGEVWESTLLFSQVDKDFREEQLGQEARFKNARLSYFNGDFQWAQAQFDVLKASTSKLIANDALDLAVFIMDNLNLDTTSAAISLYSGAELLVFQNRFEEAFQKLDTLRRDFPDHALQDDILYLEAQIFEKKREWQKAADLYQKVADTYKEDIRADNSLYALAQIYETRLNDPEKAKSIYEKIFIDYSGSVFAVDARKRFRILRGDKVQ
ncbi:MAG: tetratricopeptide repeat protein [Saprospiraceae bacterium]